jgi:hypothetical protein
VGVKLEKNSYAFFKELSRSNSLLGPIYYKTRPPCLRNFADGRSLELA